MERLQWHSSGSGMRASDRRGKLPPSIGKLLEGVTGAGRRNEGSLEQAQRVAQDQPSGP